MRCSSAEKNEQVVESTIDCCRYEDTRELHLAHESSRS
jgi:hypothetical protein